LDVSFNETLDEHVDITTVVTIGCNHLDDQIIRYGSKYTIAAVSKVNTTVPPSIAAIHIGLSAILVTMYAKTFKLMLLFYSVTSLCIYATI
jgi:acyl-[acyl carrier protein]--UDP-N-acetylglucosamine O-acyltransferase